MPAVSRRPRRDDEEPEEDDRPRSRRRDEDDEEEERPRSRRRSRDDDEEEEERPRSRRRARDDDDDEEDRPRSRRRSRDDDDEEEERPRRRTRSRDDDEEEEERPRRSRRSRDDDDDEEEERPSSDAKAGWDGYNQHKSEASEFADEFEPNEKPDLIKFLDDEPITTYKQHWVDSPPKPHKKKSWICLGKDNDCPLCDAGDRPRVLSVFNILQITSDGGTPMETPLNKIVTLGVKATGQVKNLATDRKTGPLTRHYYAVSKAGKDGGYAWNWRPVKERDIEDDWEIEPLSDKELTKAEKAAWNADDIVQVPTRKLLKEIAVALTDEDD